jgi:type IV pilus assembly protein PilW
MTQKKFIKHNQKGFTLVELFVALSIGLVLFAGIISIFIGMKTTSVETNSFGELQENGRFAISLLTDDLMRYNFWGDYFGDFKKGTIFLVPDPLPVINECTGAGLNNGTFPNGNDDFRTLWGQTVNNQNQLGCINNASIGSDIIQIKRVISSPLQDALGNPLINAPAGNFHFVSNFGQATIFSGVAVPALSNSRLWQYQHHVYYVRNDEQGANTVPVLMQGRLTTQMTFAPIVDGIEMIRFMYGVDMTTNAQSPSYGVIDSFISADNMTPALWNNAGGTRILAVKIYVLARNIRPDRSYNNTNTYLLGDLPVVVNDNFRRLLFSSTVTLYNSGVKGW